MVRELREQDAQCSIAQAASVIGDWWSLLIVREVTRGHRRFDDMLRELGISRKILTERLKHLVTHGVLTREPYQERPVRHEYVLTETGWALAPTLVSMQDWADRWLLGDGSATGAPRAGSTETARVRALLITKIPAPLPLPATTPPLEPARGTPTPTTRDTAARPPTPLDVVPDTGTATILFTYPSTGPATSLPPDWNQVPGAAGCTLENRLFRDHHPELTAAGITLHGVSTQRPDQQAAFATAEEIPFPLLSDMDLRLTAALRLPTFRAGQDLKLKRLILVIDRSRLIRHVIFPVLDIPSAIAEATEAARTLR
ncbi:winged helix-turn-helix transcriptional regulator [Nonomuraea gerenzanensis]|uniref:Transcriptional regulator, HxlR family n=1 Tax=Nonomuraea gerenzanensis TaxID=93944 RepID=A0A1M4E258_9ACTN|nr:winged helix-turn-helix transcriptional regulator [Nonomuraea gerenzanensis]UBU15093.1 winged helix-turn-helix transcriptional regulator [Nonomuraea gerenzanensis]SBO92836.1 Transcriptional regulator, HxlR family [Nonomuraea gerenzanensis]